MSLEIAGISIIAAFFAGLLSCASPCVLPMVPAYLGYLTGATLGNSANDNLATAALASGGREGASVAIATRSGGGGAPPSPFLHALSFVSGFSIVFIVFGVSLGILGFFLRDQQDIILKVAGGMLIVMGLTSRR